MLIAANAVTLDSTRPMPMLAAISTSRPVPPREASRGDHALSIVQGHPQIVPATSAWSAATYPVVTAFVAGSEFRWEKQGGFRAGGGRCAAPRRGTIAPREAGMRGAETDAWPRVRRRRVSA